MHSCIIIEDQPPAQRILQKYISDMGTLELKSTFADALSALSFLKSEKVDIIFLDVHLPKISGIDFLSVIPYQPKVILTTAFSDYALQGYELDIIDYLLKPFSFQRFVKAVSKATTAMILPKEESTTTTITPKSSPEVIFIKSGYDHIKIDLSQVCYIKSESDYTEIYTLSKKHLASYSLKYWLGKLSDSDFCQIHKSYIVNVHYINKVSGNQIHLDNQICLPIGRAYKETFNERYLKSL
ncbi:LytR/AlgR family response regulator transcription factor [Aquimarina rhabdastrellae]